MLVAKNDPEDLYEEIVHTVCVASKHGMLIQIPYFSLGRKSVIKMR